MGAGGPGGRGTDHPLPSYSAASQPSATAAGPSRGEDVVCNGRGLQFPSCSLRRAASALRAGETPSRSHKATEQILTQKYVLLIPMGLNSFWADSPKTISKMKQDQTAATKNYSFQRRLKAKLQDVASDQHDFNYCFR